MEKNLNFREKEREVLDFIKDIIENGCDCFTALGDISFGGKTRLGMIEITLREPDDPSNSNNGGDYYHMENLIFAYTYNEQFDNYWITPLARCDNHLAYSDFAHQGGEGVYKIDYKEFIEAVYDEYLKEDDNIVMEENDD